MIVERLPATLLLMAMALALSSAAGVALGTLAARRADGPADLALRGARCSATRCRRSGWRSSPCSCWPSARALPRAGDDRRPRARGRAGATPPTSLHHLVLPSLVLAAGELALTTRLVRTGLLEALGDGLRAHRAGQGPRRRAAVTRHALRNALLPVVTVIGGRLGMLVSGAVLVEAVFAWPGLGPAHAVVDPGARLPVLLGLFVLVSLAVCSATS